MWNLHKNPKDIYYNITLISLEKVGETDSY